MPKKISNVSQKILEAALNIYHEEGFEEISMRKIAKRSGLAVGTVYNRFEDKEALLAQVLAGDIEQIKTAIIGEVFGKPPKEALYAAIYTFIARTTNESHDIIKYVVDLQSQKEYIEKILLGACNQIKELVQEIIACVYRENGVELLEEESSVLAEMSLSMMQTVAHKGNGDVSMRANMVYKMILGYVGV